MRRIANILTLLLFSSLVIFVACKKKKNDDPDPLDVQGAKLKAATWVPGTIELLNSENADWSGFKINFAYDEANNSGTYTVQGVPEADGSTDVWGVSGETYTWNFDGTNTDAIIRQDGVRVTVQVGEGALLMTFTIGTSSGRVAGFEGDWKFDLVSGQ